MTILIIKEDKVFTEPQFERFMRSLEQHYADLVNDPYTTDYDRGIMMFIKGYVEETGKEFTEEQLTKLEDYVLKLEMEE